MQMTTFTAKFSLPFNAITGHKATNRIYNKIVRLFTSPFDRLVPVFQQN